MFVYGKQIFHLIPCLNQNAQDAVCLAARTGGNTFGHFFLNHSGATGNQVFVVQHFKKDLAGYIIRIVTGEDKRSAVKQLLQFQLQKVIFYDVSFQSGEVLTQIGNRFKIKLYHFHFTSFFHQELG